MSDVAALEADTAVRKRVRLQDHQLPSQLLAPPSPCCSAPREVDAALRAEAEAPFRSLRFFLFGSGCISAGLATLFTLPQLAATLGGAANAKTLLEVAQDMAINLGALALCGYLVRRDLQARDKQLARLQREEKLGALQLELANGKVVRMAQLRCVGQGPGCGACLPVAGSVEGFLAPWSQADPDSFWLHCSVLRFCFATTVAGAAALLPSLALRS